ncbi:15053_t:CDS:2, partial [Racocetra persica]
IPDNEANTAVFHYKKVKSPLLDKAMQLWIEQVVGNQIFLTEAIIKEKAEFFARALGLPDGVLKFSNGWVHKFKKSNNLRNYRLHGEANSTPLELLPGQRAKLHEIIEKYPLNNVFNADETGLFFRMAPHQTLVSQPQSGWKKVFLIYMLEPDKELSGEEESSNEESESEESEDKESESEELDEEI